MRLLRAASARVAASLTLCGAIAVLHAGWHVWAGRARWDGFGAAVAKGSNQKLGWWWRLTRLRESPSGHFVEGRC